MPDRAALRAQIQALADAGKSADEIRAIVRQGLGPTPADTAPPEPLPSPSILETLTGMGKLAAKAPGEIADNPAAAPRAAVTGAAGAATLGHAKDLHGPALERMRAKLDAGGLEPGDMQTLSMWQDANSPGRERTPITDPKAVLDELQGVHRQTQDETAAMPGTQFLGGATVASATLPGRLGGAAAGTVGKVAGTPANALGRVAAASGAGAAGGGIGSMTADALQGDFSGMLDRAKTAAGVGAIFSGAPAAAGEAAQGVGRAVVNSKGGQARQLIESEGGNVGPLTSGNKGPFAPGGRLEGRKPNSRDIGTVSRESAVNILNRTEGDLSEALASPLGKKASLDAENKGHIVVNDLVGEMQKLHGSEVLSDGEAGIVEGWLRRLDKYAVKVDGEPTGVYAMPPKKLNEFRTMLDGATGTGTDPGTVAKAKMQGVAGAARTLVDQTDYAGPNKQIHEARNQYEGARRLLRIGDSQAGGAKTPEGLPRGEVERVTQMMARQGQHTTTAGGQNASVDEGAAVPGQARENLDQLAEQFPQHKTDVRMPQVLDAKGDLQFRMLPRTDSGGLMEKLRSGAPAALAGLAAGGGTGIAAGHPLLSALLGGATMGAVNSAPAIQGRLLYTPARATAALGRGASEMAPEAGAGTANIDPLQALLDQMEATKKKGKRK